MLSWIKGFISMEIALKCIFGYLIDDKSSLVMAWSHIVWTSNNDALKYHNKKNELRPWHIILRICERQLIGGEYRNIQFKF